MQDVKLLTDKYLNQGHSLEQANNLAYLEAHAGDQQVPGGPEHLRTLTEGPHLTLCRGQLTAEIDIEKETARLMRDRGMTLEEANNAAYLMSQGAAPELYASPTTLIQTDEDLERFLIKRKNEDQAKHDRDQSIATRPKPTFEAALADVQKEFPKLLPSKQFRVAADLLAQRMLPPGGELDATAYNSGSAA